MTPSSPMLTDLYELTMSAAYFQSGVKGKGTFSLFTRKDPHRGFYVAAGIQNALDFLESLHFEDQDIAYLSDLKLFSDDFLNFLAGMRFNGEVWALAEGTPFFADEPIMEVTAPIIESQLVETYLINAVGLATMIATKGARCVHVAQGRGLIDFSLRRTQGTDAGMTVARSTYLSGFDATSNVLAGQRYGIPVSGTMAHSFVQAFPNEIDAFRTYARLFPEKTILLIDTYDTVQGAHLAVEVAHEMRAKGSQLKGVRLDSGDMIDLSRQVRRILDDGGCREVQIFASGGFDEFGLAEALAQGAPIDAFGVGTKVGVSADSPYMDLVYKLVQIDERPVRKLSTGKVTLAGQKQVYRRFSSETGQMVEDIIAKRGETIEDAEPLLAPMMRSGRRLAAQPSLSQIRDRFQRQFKAIPDAFKALEAPARFPVRVSKQLAALQQQIHH
ncbi:nicotinate phosphoribosyltransferase [Desulfatitalea tepidiphila]|uniref:nicotinate phosphoribosyltransferase n=1 Tax=Desulfatitalea tepidiphila TaxID=1185843 RepID=UPI0006B69455|nr:nicotinate phosphoribosyltransferase [Desulfatitalea tepidiphila]